MRKLLFIFVLFLVSSCTNSNMKNLDVDEFKILLDNEEVFLLDTHIPEQQHILGTDAFIPYDEIEANIDKLPTDKTTPIAIYCRSGSMSVEASQQLSELGYENVYNLLGGANSWRTKNYPFE